MNSSDFSHTNLDAELVATMAREQIRISRENYHSERKDYIDRHYYRKYVMWGNFFNRIRVLFGFKKKTLTDSDTYYQEFNSNAISLSEMITLMVVGAEHDLRIQALNEILPLAEAAMHNDGVVRLTSRHCRVLGYGPGLVPITPEEQERRRAEQELSVTLNA